MSQTGDQIAALPVTWDKKGRPQILMVTSRGSGRWVMPKGWEMDGKKRWEAAEIEALEEAGAVGFIDRKPIGKYKYKKILDNGKKMRCTVRVYPMVVEKLKKNWKERKQRTRRWFPLKAAAKRVDEKSLRKLLLKVHKDTSVLPSHPKALRKAG